MILIDSHCHLDFPDFQKDQAGVISRAHAAGVCGMVTISTHISRFPAVSRIAEIFAHKNVWCTVGTHPHHSAEEEEVDVTAEQISLLAQHPRVVGIGECGLDYYYDNSPRDEQLKSFAMQLDVAKTLDLPVIVHTRNADEDTLRLMQEAGPNVRGLLHCFSGSTALAMAALDMGFYISLSGILTFNKAEDLRETVRQIPLERLLVETDSPFLAPVPLRGKTNEPAYTVHTAKKLAEIKGVSLEELAQATTANFFKVFTRAQWYDSALVA